MWDRNCPLAMHVDPPMHLIFLGVVKAVLKQTFQFCRLARIQKALNTVGDHMVEMVRRIGLKNVRLEPLEGGNLGGWVSENYVGFMKIMPWIFQNITNWKEEEPEYKDPEGDYKKWTGEQCRLWLKARKMKTTGSAEDKKNRVSAAMTSKNGPPPLPTLKGATIKDLKCALSAMGRFVGAAMQPVFDELMVVTLDFYVKCFLTYYELLDRGMRDKDKPPSWVTSYNFLCLLNLPATACFYGPLRNLWEGGLNGEGIIRFVKREIDGGLRDGWQLATMKRLYFVRQMQSIDEDIQGPPAKQKEKEWERYKDINKGK